VQGRRPLPVVRPGRWACSPPVASRWATSSSSARSTPRRWTSRSSTSTASSSPSSWGPTASGSPAPSPASPRATTTSSGLCLAAGDRARRRPRRRHRQGRPRGLRRGRDARRELAAQGLDVIFDDRREGEPGGEVQGLRAHRRPDDRRRRPRPGRRRRSRSRTAGRGSAARSPSGEAVAEVCREVRG
jgi:hypothetical protein